MRSPETLIPAARAAPLVRLAQGDAGSFLGGSQRGERSIERASLTVGVAHGPEREGEQLPDHAAPRSTARSAARIQRSTACPSLLPLPEGANGRSLQVRQQATKWRPPPYEATTP